MQLRLLLSTIHPSIPSPAVLQSLRVLRVLFKRYTCIKIISHSCRVTAARQMLTSRLDSGLYKSSNRFLSLCLIQSRLVIVARFPLS